MTILDFDNRQPAFGQRRMRQALAQAAKDEFVWTDVKHDWSAGVVPTARFGRKIQSAAVRDQAGLNGGVWRAQRDGVVTKSGIYVSEGWQDLFEKFITCAVGLGHCSETPDILLR